MSLPILDLRSINQEPGKLLSALKNEGFFYLKNHGVSEDLINSLTQISRKFFEEPSEFKSQIQMSHRGKTWRGYFQVGAELTSGIPDIKEGIYFGQDTDGIDLPLHGRNIFPDGEKYKEFKSLIDQYMTHMESIGLQLMRAIAQGLSLDKNFFDKDFGENNLQLFRIFNYPAQSIVQEDKKWGVQEHTDMGFLTILYQDQNGGLSVKSRNGQWIEAPPVEDSFVVNIGDMLEYWTRGILRATPHRVKNMAKTDRISMPFFFDPGWNSKLTRIGENLLPKNELLEVEPGMARKWDGMDLSRLAGEVTYGEYVWSKVRRVFPDLAKKS